MIVGIYKWRFGVDGVFAVKQTDLAKAKRLIERGLHNEFTDDAIENDKDYLLRVCLGDLVVEKVEERELAIDDMLLDGGYSFPVDSQQDLDDLAYDGPDEELDDEELDDEELDDESDDDESDDDESDDDEHNEDDESY